MRSKACREITGYKPQDVNTGENTAFQPGLQHRQFQREAFPAGRMEIKETGGVRTQKRSGGGVISGISVEIAVWVQGVNLGIGLVLGCAGSPGDIGGGVGPDVLHDGLYPVPPDAGCHGGQSELPFFSLKHNRNVLTSFYLTNQEQLSLLLLQVTPKPSYTLIKRSYMNLESIVPLHRELRDIVASRQIDLPIQICCLKRREVKKKKKTISKTL